MSAALPRDTPYDQQVLRHLAGEIITNVRELAQAGWTPATSTPPSVAIGTSWSGSRTRPAIMAPVSRPTNAQNTGASEPNTTAASDLPETFHDAS